jgi:xanthine dehydrogenase large subunit
VDRGQIEGGFIQGMGWLTSEELVWNEKGHLLSHGASTYDIPTLGDAPPVFRVELLSDAAQPGTVYGSKAVGEPPLMLAISVREAIKDALASARSQRGADNREILLASPATCEAVFRALQQLPPSADASKRILV